MRPNTSLTLLAACILCFGVTLASADDDAKRLAKAVDTRYNNLTTLRADFTETYEGAGANKQESGKLTLKRPGRMRWDYTSPQPKLFVTDGKTAYFYVPGEQQARRAPVKKLDDFRSPLRYLLGKARIAKEFSRLVADVPAKPMQPGNMQLSGVPDRMSERVERVVFEVSKQMQIQRIAITEIDGTVTEFRFTNIVENAPIADAEFRFKPPAGVELIEAGEISGN